jgi:hypothetical protein
MACLPRRAPKDPFHPRLDGYYKIWRCPLHTVEHQHGNFRSEVSHRRKGFGPKLQAADILPRCAISKRLRYEKQIKALHLFRLLSLEMLHRRVEIEKQDFRKKAVGRLLKRNVAFLHRRRQNREKFIDLFLSHEKGRMVICWVNTTSDIKIREPSEALKNY